MSRVTAIISALVICIIVCPSWAVNVNVITPLPTKPSATNARELKLANAAITVRGCVSVMLLRSMQKIHEGVSRCWSWKWCSAWWCCWSSSVAHQSSLSVSAWSHHAPAWIMQPPPTGRHRWTGLFHPQREADHYAKTTGRNPEVYRVSVDRVAHIDGQLMQLLWAIHTRFQRSINVCNKTSNHANVCWVSVLTTFLRRHNYVSTVFFCPPRNEEMMGDGFGATAAGLFWTVNVCWAHPVLGRASAVASSIFFMVLFPMLFEVRRIVCVEN